MKKQILTLWVALLALCQSAFAYDFSAVSPSGHTLYYNIAGDNAVVVRPGTGNEYNNYVTGDVIVPSSVTYNGVSYPVTALAVLDNYGSFEACSGLTSVTIPNTVTEIGAYAFFQCSGLTNFTIPNTVTTIGNSAFRRCTSLASINIPNSVTDIESFAFLYCISLSTVTIPNSVTNIGEGAFSRVNNIEYSGTATGSPWGAKTVNGYVEDGFVYADDTKTTVTGYIGNATDVVIPNTVTRIGNAAFYGMSQLTSITIPASMVSIGVAAFFECNNIDTTYYLGTIAQWCNIDFASSEANPVYYSENLFINGTLVTNLVIPDGVTEIKRNTFYYCFALTSVTIPNSVTTIGDSAFRYCTHLAPVLIPNTVTSIGTNAFYKVRKILYDGTATGSPWGALSMGGYLEDDFVYSDDTKTTLIGYIGSATDIVIPSTVTRIGDSAFLWNSNLTSVTIPNTVTSIGAKSFYYCKGLTSIDIPNSVTNIGENAFYYCSGLSSVTIGNSVTNIGNYTFFHCNLSTVTIPNTVTEIGNYAFYGCSLITVTIPNSVTSIGGNAFAYCSELTSVTIGNSVTSVGVCAFQSTGLTSVTLGKSLTSIGSHAFYGCYNLSEIYSKAEMAPIVNIDNSFYGVPSSARIYVPCGSDGSYASTWTNFNNFIETGCTGISGVSIYEDGSAIIVEGAADNLVTLHNASGNVIATKAATVGTPLLFEHLASGTYFVKIGDIPARMKVEVQ